jgi:hypothetical protein
LTHFLRLSFGCLWEGHGRFSLLSFLSRLRLGIRGWMQAPALSQSVDLDRKQKEHLPAKRLFLQMFIYACIHTIVGGGRGTSKAAKIHRSTRGTAQPPSSEEVDDFFDRDVHGSEDESNRESTVRIVIEAWIVMVKEIEHALSSTKTCLLD